MPKLLKCGLLIFLVMLLLAGGCASRQASVPVPEPAVDAEEVAGPRLVAVMPVDNRTDDELAPAILRNELRQQLYFKGYPVIPATFIDERLSALTENGDLQAVSAQAAGRALDVDALLYSTLAKWSTSRALLYATTKVSASFVLKCARTGEVLWSEAPDEKNRHMAITGGRAKAKAHISYDEALQTMMAKIMETFPDGPDAVGPVAPDTRTWYQRLLRR